jgi:hypothetical protein
MFPKVEVVYHKIKKVMSSIRNAQVVGSIPFSSSK